MKSLFLLADVSGDGFIQEDEFEAFKMMTTMAVKRVQKYPLSENLKKQFDELDANKDNKLSFDECKKLILNTKITEE